MYYTILAPLFFVLYFFKTELRLYMTKMKTCYSLQHREDSYENTENKPEQFPSEGSNKIRCGNKA